MEQFSDDWRTIASEASEESSSECTSSPELLRAETGLTAKMVEAEIAKIEIIPLNEAESAKAAEIDRLISHCSLAIGHARYTLIEIPQLTNTIEALVNPHIENPLLADTLMDALEPSWKVYGPKLHFQRNPEAVCEALAIILIICSTLKQLKALNDQERTDAQYKRLWRDLLVYFIGRTVKWNTRIIAVVVYLTAYSALPTYLYEKRNREGEVKYTPWRSRCRICPDQCPMLAAARAYTKKRAYDLENPTSEDWSLSAFVQLLVDNDPENIMKLSSRRSKEYEDRRLFYRYSDGTERQVSSAKQDASHNGERASRYAILRPLRLAKQRAARRYVWLGELREAL